MLKRQSPNYEFRVECMDTPCGLVIFKFEDLSFSFF
uniref:Uncharacterized protein n=1 Tax=Rhizophora mucronata TaxID=61149 RepID=A0A2P2QCS8_RHIMU